VYKFDCGKQAHGPVMSLNAPLQAAGLVNSVSTGGGQSLSNLNPDVGVLTHQRTSDFWQEIREHGPSTSGTGFYGEMCSEIYSTCIVRNRILS
jgi:hypothetical protein